MAETFSKLFASITDSSVWSEDDETRLVWITMLAMADRNGYVAAAIPGLAARARVSVEATERALAKFLAPDPYSRSKEFEGRRIEETDRGWNLLNYERFRDMRDEEARRAYERERKREQRRRAREKDEGDEDGDTSQGVPDTSGQSRDVPQSPAVSAHAEAEAEAEVEAEADPGPSSSSSMRSVGPGSLNGYLHEIDMVRRQVEAETRTTIGALTHRLDKLDGLAPAIADLGLPRVLEVVGFRCEQVATGQVEPQLWRRLFSGDGFYAALEQLERSERAAEARAAEPPVRDPTEEERRRIGQRAEEARRRFRST